MSDSVKYPDAFVQLTGEDGNAGSIMAAVSQELKAVGVPKEEIEEFRMEFMFGGRSYDENLQWIMTLVEVG